MLPLSRRRAAILAAATAAFAVPRPSAAQDAPWPPGRPIRLVVPFAAAGSSDAIGRFLAERLARHLNQPVVVENRPGAGGTVGAAEVARAAPDGTAFLIITTNHAINETLQPRRGYAMLRDLTPVARINALPLALAVAHVVPARTVAELVAHAKANPGRLDYASSGPGSLYHLFTEEFCRRAGIAMQHIPFRNFNEGRTALVAGQVQVIVDAAFTLAPLIQGGQIRGLATTGAQRLSLLPDLPLIGETVPGMEATLWNGLLGPANLPRRVVEGMNAAMNAVLSDPAVVEAQARLGAVVTPATPEAFAAFLRREIETQAEAVRIAGVQPE
jgi:tripartite-type tricarboxylate transporter receptor subunit TctC